MSSSEILQALQRIEHNQQQALALQAEHLALARSQLERNEARIQESLELQKLAIRRQSRLVLSTLPLILLALAAVGYLILRYF